MRRYAAYAFILWQVLPEVSTPFLYALGSLSRRTSIVDGNPSTMLAKWMLENVQGCAMERDD